MNIPSCIYYLILFDLGLNLLHILRIKENKYNVLQKKKNILRPVLRSSEQKEWFY